MAKLALIVWAVLILFPPLVDAQEYGGKDIVTGIKTPDHEMVVSSINGGAVYVVWNLKSLMGEPLLIGKGVVIIPNQSSYRVNYKNQRYNVPAEIFKKIKPITVKVKAKISPTMFVDFDLGAMGDIYFGSLF